MDCDFLQDMCISCYGIEFSCFRYFVDGLISVYARKLHNINFLLLTLN